MNNINVFKENNSWWETGKAREALLERVPRDLFPELLSTLPERQILMLKGPRRVGKTSLMYHLIDHLLSSSVPPQNIFYLLMDDPLIQNREKIFSEIISFYEKNILGKPFYESKEKLYFFLDEIVKIPNWELYLKKYYDQKYPIKFIVSSSSSAFLESAKDSLAGRIIDYLISPFSFAEYLILKNASAELVDFFKNGVKRCWHNFAESRNLEKCYKELVGLNKEIELKREVEFSLDSYLGEGGFPEYLALKSQKLIEEYFWTSVIERVIFHDIPEIFKVEDKELLQKLMLYAIFNSGTIINIQDLAASFSSPRQTISNYLNYLQTSQLVILLEKYAKTKMSRMRAFKKIYIIDTGLFTNIQKIKKEERVKYEGALAEICVLRNLRGYFPYLNLYYFREREKEVDFVVEAEKRELLPFEVKYRTQVSDLEGLTSFSRRFKDSKGRGLIITKDYLGFKNENLYVPLKLFIS